jgi:plastocyanin
VTRLATCSLALLLAVGCSGGSSSDEDGGAVTTTGTADAQTATVDMNDKLQFVPTTVNAKVGSVTLDVVNVGMVPHNLHFDDDALGKTGTIDGKADEKLTVTFSQAGTFTFVCTFHPGMTGKVVVS